MKNLKNKYVLLLLLILIIGFWTLKDMLSNKQETPIEQEDGMHIQDPIEIDDFYIASIYNPEGFTGEYKTYSDDQHQSKFGIDVSEFQRTIDWKKVKESGIDFAYIRLGYHSNRDYLLHVDSMFYENYENAKDNDVMIGVYFASQAINTVEVKEEVDFILDVVKKLDIDLPIVFDYEEPANSRISGLTAYQKTAICQKFCDELKNNNYNVIVYTNQYFSSISYNLDKMQDLHYWFAQYNVEKPDYDLPICMWQYSETGQIDGIEGNVDLDIMFTQKRGLFE